jgi:hypothetical protein
MKMSTILFLLLTGLDQLDRLNGLDQVMYVGIDSHLLLEMGYGQGTDCFGKCENKIGGKVVLVSLR